MYDVIVSSGQCIGMFCNFSHSIWFVALSLMVSRPLGLQSSLGRCHSLSLKVVFANMKIRTPWSYSSSQCWLALAFVILCAGKSFLMMETVNNTVLLLSFKF